MISWPSSLVRELAQRRCILFIGAGVSATAKSIENLSPPTWKSFLVQAVKILILDKSDHDEIVLLIENGDLILALQAIYCLSNKADFYDLINKNFHSAKYLPSDLHKSIYQLDSRIVITTNFDKIYENYCTKPENEGFKVICYDSNSLADEIRSDVRLIIKAHGTIDNVHKMIFTKQQYHSAKSEHRQFYEILKALLVTHTCIFIGCSMNDPDINLLLEDVKILGSSVRPHYCLILKNSHSKFKMDDWESTYNVKSLEYGPSHDSLIENLAILLAEVENIRLATHQ